MRSHFVEEDLPTLMAGPEKRDPPSPNRGQPRGPIPCREPNRPRSPNRVPPWRPPPVQRQRK